MPGCMLSHGPPLGGARMAGGGGALLAGGGAALLARGGAALLARGGGGGAAALLARGGGGGGMRLAVGRGAARWVGGLPILLLMYRYMWCGFVVVYSLYITLRNREPHPCFSIARTGRTPSASAW